MGINYLAVLVCGIISMIIGAIWYGPVFGTRWLKIIGATSEDLEKRKEMQKKAMPLYLIQFLLALGQVFILAVLLSYIKDLSGVIISILVYLGFVIPSLAGASMWNNEDLKTSISRFLIQSGYQFVMVLIYGFILTTWLP